ncbi:hypothetical protein [Candidatus Berkiella aquae]|uniref:Uncharacterized protein n=1 Tax=Candidatus Berkiella aquae TaxID=295108 RepID=A0A0Q9YL65_9GAMM|nr:hypothetical protein [Candidatus Berkiella aquae]MCS5711430.1 hypothetical protein [Candidatus Berkiella aquae]
MQHGPKSQMELKFERINRAQSYAEKRNLIEQLTDDERTMYNKQQEAKYKYDECMPQSVLPVNFTRTYTPANNAANTARKGVVIRNAPAANISDAASPNTSKLTK